MGGLCKRPSPASTTSPRVASRVLLWNAGPRGWGVLPCVLVAVAVGLCHMAVCKEPERGSWVTRISDAPSTWRWRPMSRAQWLPHLKRLHSEGFRWDPCRTIVGFGSTLVFSFCGSFGVSILRRKPGSESSSNPGWCDPRWVGVPGPGTQYHTTRTPVWGGQGQTAHQVHLGRLVCLLASLFLCSRYQRCPRSVSRASQGPRTWHGLRSGLHGL